MSSSEDDSDTDPGKIRFENESRDSARHSTDEVGEAVFLPRRSARIQKSRKLRSNASPDASSPVSSAKGEVVLSSGRNKRLNDHTLDESDTQEPRKKLRLVKGKRPKSPLTAEDEDEDLTQELDEDS